MLLRLFTLRFAKLPARLPGHEFVVVAGEGGTADRGEVGGSGVAGKYPGGAHGHGGDDGGSQVGSGIAVLPGFLDRTGDLPMLLTGARDAFGIIHGVCRISQARSDDLSDAFATAAESALRGRNLLAAAASMPPAQQTTPVHVPVEATSLEYDLEEITAILVGLVSILASRLRQAGTRAAHARDRLACYNAAAKAGSICDLLTPWAASLDAYPGELSTPGPISARWPGPQRLPRNSTRPKPSQRNRCHAGRGL